MAVGGIALACPYLQRALPSLWGRVPLRRGTADLARSTYLSHWHVRLRGRRAHRFLAPCRTFQHDLAVGVALVRRLRTGGACAARGGCPAMGPWRGVTTAYCGLPRQSSTPIHIMPTPYSTPPSTSPAHGKGVTGWGGTIPSIAPAISMTM